MAEKLPIEKRIVCTAFCLFPPALIRLRRPLSPVCALGTSPKRGSALRGGGLSSPPLAPLLGELSPKVTEGSPWQRNCQEGKEMSALRPVFSLLLLSDSGDPFPQCAHWGLPLKGAAPCGAEDYRPRPWLPLRGSCRAIARLRGRHGRETAKREKKCLHCVLSFPSCSYPTPATPFPSVRTGDFP